MRLREFRMGLSAGPIFLALVAACLTGCSSDAVPRRHNGIIVGSQGAGSEVVFPGVQIAAALDGQSPGPEYSRRDASLSFREPMTAFAYDAWPQAPQPTLYQARELTLPTTPNTYLYFNSTGSYQSRSVGSNWQGAGWYWP